MSVLLLDILLHLLSTLEMFSQSLHKHRERGEKSRLPKLERPNFIHSLFFLPVHGEWGEGSERQTLLAE